MKTLLLIWSLVLGHCLAGPFFFGRQGAVANSAPAACTPASLGADLKLALVANDIAGSDGSAVSSWSAAYSTANSVSQATSSRQPTLKTAFVNGQHAVLFDKVDDYMATAGDVTSLEGITSLSLVFVAKGSWPISGIGPVIAKHSSGTAGSWFAGLAGGASGYQFTVINSTPSRVNLTDATSDTNWHVFTMDWDGTTMRLYVDGVVRAGTAAQSGAIQNTTYPVTIGATDSGRFLFGGHVAEIGAVTPSLSAVNRQSYETYLGTRYGITITH